MALTRLQHSVKSTQQCTCMCVVVCGSQPEAEQGAVRLIDGVGSPCDPLYTGILEVFNEGRWGAVCTFGQSDAIVADVVCRQLGFPFGNPVDGDFAFDDDGTNEPETFDESEIVSDTVWLFGATCRGPEDNLSDCLGDYYDGFSDGTSTRPCTRRLHIACRQFAVDDALEETSGTAGAPCSPYFYTCISTSICRWYACTSVCRWWRSWSHPGDLGLLTGEP